MEFLELSFEVGEDERHRVYVSHNPIFSWISIEVDEETVREGIIGGRSILKWVKRWKFTVGYKEKHQVVIACKPHLTIFHRCSCQIHIDGELVEQHGPEADFSQDKYPLWFRIFLYITLIFAILILSLLFLLARLGLR